MMCSSCETLLGFLSFMMYVNLHVNYVMAVMMASSISDVSDYIRGLWERLKLSFRVPYSKTLVFDLWPIAEWLFVWSVIDIAGSWGCYTLLSSYNWFPSMVLLLEEVRGVRSLSWVAYSTTTALLFFQIVLVWYAGPTSVVRTIHVPWFWVHYMWMLGLGNLWFWFTFIGS